MTKSDLKTGMIVQIAEDNHLCLVIANTLVDLEPDIKKALGGCRLQRLNEQMELKEKHLVSNWTINKVYSERVSYEGSSLITKMKNPEELKGSLLWERPKKILEISLKQLCNMVGQEIKIISE